MEEARVGSLVQFEEPSHRQQSILRLPAAAAVEGEEEDCALGAVNGHDWGTNAGSWQE